MIKKKIFIICLTILILLIFYFIFSQDSTNNQQNDKSKVELPKWTVMIYMSGDNWLSDMIPKNLGHMKSVGSSKDVNIITLVDEKGSNNSNLYYIEIYDVNETPLNVLNPQYNDELNLGEANSLSDFVIWAMDQYPAEHYFLDIWGHGEGWKGVAYDGVDYLSMSELESALKNIVENNNNEKLDIVGFDACNMGMIEVFYQIKNYTGIVIASEKEIPERGWPYYEILMNLRQNPEISPIEFSELIVNQFCTAYSSGELDNEKLSVALSAINLDQIDGIIENLEFISIDKYLLEYYENPDYVDLYHYGQENKLQDLMDTINNSVIAENHWSNPNGEKIEHAYGMTIYYPKEYDNKYDNLKFSEDTKWDDGLKGVS